MVELEQLLSINFMQINREKQQRWELSPKALKGDVKMKHCITVNYARAHNAEIALSTSKRSPFPLPSFTVLLLFCPTALWHFLRVGTMTTG